MSAGPTAPRAATESRGNTVQDDPKIVPLPRFSRDIAVLAGRGARRSDAVGRASIGVLEPFSGHLDVRFGTGRVPTLDLSYLTLAPLLASAEHRSTSRGPRSIEAAGGDRKERSTGRPTTEMTARQDPDDRPVEPTVREVLQHSRDVHAAEDRSRGTPVDGTGRTTGVGEDTPSSGDRSLADERASDPDSTLLNPGLSGERPPATEGRGPGSRDSAEANAAAEPTMWALDRSAREGAERSDEGPRRVPLREPSPPGRGPGLSGAEAGVPPPRMVTDAGSGHDGAAMEGTTSATTTGSVTMSIATEGPARAEAPATSADAQSPRLVLDRRGSGPAAAGEDRGVGARSGRRSTGPEGPDEAADRAADSSADLDDLLSAAPDPESPAIDRLYRALHEREAIERRRGGDL